MDLHLEQFFPDIDENFLNFTLQKEITSGELRRIRGKYGANINLPNLSFFGDTVLELITARRLIDYTNLVLKPYDYHLIKQNFVNNQNLTNIGIAMGLNFPRENLNRGKDWHNPFSDTVEAMLGMLYLQFNNIETIKDWFFSFDEVEDNFQEKVKEFSPSFYRKFIEPQEEFFDLEDLPALEESETEEFFEIKEVEDSPNFENSVSKLQSKNELTDSSEIDEDIIFLNLTKKKIYYTTVFYEPYPIRKYGFVNCIRKTNNLNNNGMKAYIAYPGRNSCIFYKESDLSKVNQLYRERKFDQIISEYSKLGIRFQKLELYNQIYSLSPESTSWYAFAYNHKNSFSTYIYGTVFSEDVLSGANDKLKKK